MEVKNKEGVLDIFDKFCHHTNLHAYVYLRRNNPMPNIDRFLWVCIILLNLGLSGFVLWDAWHEWADNPFVIVYDPMVKYIWEIPFPAVTVCSLAAVKMSTVDLTNLSLSHSKLFYFASLVCPNEDFFHMLNPTAEEEEMESFYSFLKEVTPSCPEVLDQCVWQGKEFDCCQLFHPVITDIGLCYTFNSLPTDMLFTKEINHKFLFEDSALVGAESNSNHWFWTPAAEGYPTLPLMMRTGGRAETVLPRWAQGFGFDSGLSVRLTQASHHVQQHCSAGSSGFKVTIHTPEEVSLNSKVALRVPLGQETVLQLMPVTITSPQELRSTLVAERGCLYEGELQLQYFRHYTQSHCMQECRSRSFLAECGCVPYYSPRNQTTPICSKFADRACLQNVEEHLVMENINQNEYVEASEKIPLCNCYPACNLIDFDINPLNGQQPLHNGNLNNVSERNIYAKLTLSYNKMHFLGIHREIISSYADFLGNCGGLLSLLMGFSTIALIDVFYHFLLRPTVCTRRISTAGASPLTAPRTLRLPFLI